MRWSWDGSQDRPLLAMQPKMALNSQQSPCLSFPRIGDYRCAALLLRPSHCQCPCPSTPSFHSTGTCLHGGPCTEHCPMRVCAATGGALPSPAPEAPSWTRPCPTTFSSARLHPTTVRCLQEPTLHPAWGAYGVSEGWVGALMGACGSLGSSSWIQVYTRDEMSTVWHHFSVS